MTVRELIEELSKMPPDREVYRADGGDCPGFSRVILREALVWPWSDDNNIGYRGEMDGQCLPLRSWDKPPASAQQVLLCSIRTGI